MRALMVIVLALALTLLIAVPALAIVHATSPILCTPAVGASGGSAGGVAAFSVLDDNPNVQPPMPAQGGAKAAVCD
jgi:membrane associated rhomboid family serine protease